MECTVVRDEMVEVLYGEASPDASRRLDQHLALCAACRDEMAALRSLRRDLGGWKLPQLTRARADAGSRRQFWVPLAAAAGFVLALGAGLAFSGSELSFDRGRLALRLGWGADVVRELKETEARHQREIAALRAAHEPPAGSGNSALLDQVQALLRESEARQAQRLDTQLHELSTRSEAQRRYDLARVSAGLSYLDGKTGQHVARTAELMGYVLQAAEGK
jgi:hypothetical protein